MWCKECDALMGMREPYHDWSVSHGICSACLTKMPEYLPDDLTKVEELPSSEKKSET
jgi:hypothetical protein